ncbi:hypothetical protein [Antarcticirhabdus aurantiaca]|uniref:Uncharacterized protein n=1 Tax=Antarcticirhabdus aurantiaca TaxID=2606717 RepID=A0ACD4NVY3_9HYPH|nr:hypothetical protein [Antarcticirhabdus aurantiaca]WAJ31150.1 hypothetical protein OXU80_13505 [Jeongeuplla avenae]
MKILPNSSYIVLTIAVLIMVAVLIGAGELTCYAPSQDDPVRGWKTCILFRLFKEMQTLVAGIIALLAAMLALRPVWMQLGRMAQQNEIASREIIAERLAALEMLIAEDRERISRTLSNFDHAFDQEHGSFRRPLDMQWVHNREHEIASTFRNLRNSQALMLGTDRIEAQRHRIISSLELLNRCLGTIIQPVHFYPPDEYWPGEDRYAEMEEAAAFAADELDGRWSDAVAAFLQFEELAEEELSAIRRRIRQIDDMVVRQQP